MKTWNQPNLEELEMSATAYAPEKGSRVDGSYVSKDGQHTYFTYAPSGAATNDQAQ